MTTATQKTVPQCIGLLLVGLILAIVPSGIAKPDNDDDDDDDEKEYNKAVAKRAVAENCRICHTDDLISGQRLSPAQWQAEVEKMVGWGSPLAKDDQPKVIAYLAEEYSPSVPGKLADRMTLSEATAWRRPEAIDPGVAGADVVAGESRFLKDCANCHGKNGQGADLGPNLVERPVLFQPTLFHKVVKEGRGRMPAFKDQIDAVMNADVMQWLKGRRFSPNP